MINWRYRSGYLIAYDEQGAMLSAYEVDDFINPKVLVSVFNLVFSDVRYLHHHR
jgi:hypothetical protein